MRAANWAELNCMPKAVRLTLTINPGERTETMEATFPDEDWDRLIDFLTYARELEQTELLSKGYPLGLTFKTENGGTRVSSNLPPDDQISAVLHRIRPFVLQDEPTNYYAVSKLLSRRFESDLMRLTLSRLKEFYSGKDSQRMYTLTADDTIINFSSSG
jgi:hypothetical protein